MRPQCMIFNLNVMLPSQSKRSLYGMRWVFLTHFNFSHSTRSKAWALSLFWFNLTWSLPLLTRLVFQITYWFTLAQSAPSSNSGGKYFHVFLTHLNLYLHSSYSLASFFNHFHCMTSPP